MTRRIRIRTALSTAALAAWLMFAGQAHPQNPQSDDLFGGAPPTSGNADEAGATAEAAPGAEQEGSGQDGTAGGSGFGGYGGAAGGFGGYVPGSGSGYGGYSGGGEYGGGMPGGPGMSYGGQLSRTVMVQSGTSRDGAPRWTKLTADRVIPFQYRLGSMQPAKLPAGDEYDMYGDASMGGGMGMYSGGEGGGYGGEAGIGSGGSEGSGYAGPGTTESWITIYAYVIDQEPIDGRSRVELLIEPQPRRAAGGQVEASGGGYGGMAGPPSMDRLDVLLELQKDRAAAAELELELELVANIIRQTIWKEDLVKQLNKHATDPQQVETAEKVLKQILTEEYETQLARQELEITGIERRVSQLREELSRRRTAKQRVVEVQLGRIVLEAQGLLAP